MFHTSERLARILPKAFIMSILGMLAAGGAHASEAIELPPFADYPFVNTVLWVVFFSAIIGILFGLGWLLKIMKQSPGSQAMQDVSKAVQEGAMAYLARQVKTMIWFVIAIAIGLYFLYSPLPEFGPKLALGIAIAFILGVAASYGAGFIGMYMAVRANVRTATAALTSFKGALGTAFQAGAVSGMATVGLGLLGATIIFFIFQEQSMKVLIGFGFGGCLAALFMRIGGGIFTKAADVGADLVGKIEAGIPEDDPRNAATIADNVGDNVGDCAGMAADVFESYEVTLVAAIILGAAASGSVGGADNVMKLIMYPLLVRAVGVIASIIGVFMVRGRDDMDMDPMKPINTGFYGSALFATIGFTLVSYFMFKDGIGKFQWWQFAAANFMGIVLTLVIGKLTEYFTHIDKGPVTEAAYATRTGPATLILTGFASGLESSVWGIVAIAGAILGSYMIFQGDPAMAAYGIALSGLGLLTTTGYLLAMDTFGPISDNANGIFEMSGALKEQGENSNASRIVAKLDAVGNTTKALTKGFAIATAVIAATALFRSFMADANLLPPTVAQLAKMTPEAAQYALMNSGIHIEWTEVFIGFLIGGAVPFLFCSFAIKAVSRAAFLLVEEVRRQFREHPGIMDFKEKPDYARCVAISTTAAQKELIGPAILAVATPILVVFGLGYTDPMRGAAALGGYLAGAILTGQLMAVFLSNTGGLWDNAKKKIEEGLFGGKGTEFHKAGVVGDTVGDPFKDTAGPALNPLIKVMNLVAILMAPIAIAPIAVGVRTTIVLVAVIALTAAVMFSKRGGITKEDIAAAEAMGKEPKPVEK